MEPKPWGNVQCLPRLATETQVGLKLSTSNKSVICLCVLNSVLKPLFVCRFRWSREFGRQGDINTKLAIVNLSHTYIGLTPMIMNCTDKEILIQLLDDNTYINCYWACDESRWEANLMASAHHITLLLRFSFLAYNVCTSCLSNDCLGTGNYPNTWANILC